MIWFEKGVKIQKDKKYYNEKWVDPIDWADLLLTPHDLQKTCTTGKTGSYNGLSPLSVISGFRWISRRYLIKCQTMVIQQYSKWQYHNGYRTLVRKKTTQQLVKENPLLEPLNTIV